MIKRAYDSARVAVVVHYSLAYNVTHDRKVQFNTLDKIQYVKTVRDI